MMQTFASARRLPLVIALAVMVSVGWMSSPLIVLAADTTPPVAPKSFQATVESGESAVTLNWQAATDAGGIKSYRLERSLDQEAWKVVGEAITELTYRDITTGFGLHYYYRLNAADAAGNVSAWVTADVTTDDVKSGSLGSAEIVLTSLDKIATVRLPAGAVANEISCNVNKVGELSGRKLGTEEEPLVVGAYELSCKTTPGSVVTDYKFPATWTFELKSKIKNLKDPVIYGYAGADSDPELAKGQEYDSKTQIIKGDLPPMLFVAVQAKVPRVFSPNILVIILTVIGIVVAIVMFAVNRKKKLEYEEYLRSKYYDL